MEGGSESAVSFSIQKEITFLKQIPGFGQFLGIALQRIEDGVNNMGQNLAVDPSGTLPSPPPIQSLTVKTNGTGLVHAVISDGNAIAKHLNYFLEYSTNASFFGAHVKQLGASRSMEPIILPANDDNGNPQKFFFRAYSQYLGSKPGPKINFGGSVPTAVSPGGTQQLTLIPSTGSGTAQNSGEQAGAGFGNDLFRPSTMKVKAST